MATVQEETRSYPCEAGAPSHRIDLPPDAGEGDRKMQWVYGNTTIATYPPSQHLPSVLDVGEWGICVTSCMNLTLLVFDATGKERRTHYTASPGNLLVRNQSDGQRSDPSGAWRHPPGNSGGFGATLLISLLTPLGPGPVKVPGRGASPPHPSGMTPAHPCPCHVVPSCGSRGYCRLQCGGCRWGSIYPPAPAQNPGVRAAFSLLSYHCLSRQMAGPRASN
ncbi:unnamed protein product [Eretmochelys imbricata]